ncbi:MAG: hypothetical protein HZB83_06630 [Deltaproteobacteria bacterium]|nr:hypothetical protein [Deltaproteobacteria bacterium]
MCYRCHQMPPHPAREGVTQTMVVFASPNHLRVPPDHIRNNIRISLKDAPVILPLEPKTGKIFCATCHNPHERGVLTDRADMGADSTRRLRTPGVDICEYCHRK